MSKRMVAKKLEVCSDLGVVEKAVAMAVLEKRHNLAKLKKTERLCNNETLHLSR